MDNPQPPPLPHAATTVHGCATSHGHCSLQSLLMKCAIASAPAKSLSLQQITFIEKRFQDFSSTVHTPDHPPYASMIEKAITHLNEEGGSSEEAISKFILEEYKDLPWAHADLLKHHLNRLSESGNLTESHDGCYFIDRSSSRSPSPSPSPTSSSSPSPTSSSSASYASSDTSSSDQSCLKRGRKKKSNCKRTKSQQRKQRETKIHHEGRARGRGRGRDWDMNCGNPFEDDKMTEVYIGEMADDMCMHHMQNVEIHCLLSEDEAADENTQEKEQANQDYVDLGSREQQSMTDGRAPNPGPRITCTTNRSPSLSLSPSPSPSSSSSPSYSSSDTSGSDQSFNLKRGRKKKSTCKRKKSQQRNRRGTKIQPKGLARGQGFDDPCKEDMMKEVYIDEGANDTCMHGLQTVEIHSLLTEDEATDENIKGKERANQDHVDLGSREQQNIVIDVESPEHEYRIDEARIEPVKLNMGDDHSAPSTSKRVRQPKRNIHSRHEPQTGMGRGRSRERETGNNMNLPEATEIRAVKVVNERKTRKQSRLIEDQCYSMNDDNPYVNRVEHEEEDSLDVLIDQVHEELRKATETLHLTMDDELAEARASTARPEPQRRKEGSARCSSRPVRGT